MMCMHTICTYTLIPSQTNQTKMDPNKKISMLSISCHCRIWWARAFQAVYISYIQRIIHNVWIHVPISWRQYKVYQLVTCPRKNCLGTPKADGLQFAYGLFLLKRHLTRFQQLVESGLAKEYDTLIHCKPTNKGTKIVQTESRPAYWSSWYLKRIQKCGF